MSFLSDLKTILGCFAINWDPFLYQVAGVGASRGEGVNAEHFSNALGSPLFRAYVDMCFLIHGLLKLLGI